MLQKLLNNLFGDRHQREMKRLQPILDDINSRFYEMENLSDNELRDRVKVIKKDIRSQLQPIEDELEELREEYRQEADENKKNNIGNIIDKKAENLKQLKQDILDGYLPEVYAIVKDTCRRLLGYEYEVRGNPETWNMVPFDVQLMGAIVLHEGKIAEMATGEGKTLVATLPLFLNALLGKGVHLITVNDYLAQRDSEWMAPIFEFHGLTVGCNIGGMDNKAKRAAYELDVTYGTNSEFGFDYLRDNMASSIDDLVQRDLQYAIVDEVDSVLIDEARTPLIISGPVAESKNFYKELKPVISKLVFAQNQLVKRYLAQIKTLVNSEEADFEELGRLLLLVKRAAPRNKQFLKLMKEGELKKLVTDYEGTIMRDKKMYTIDEELFFSVDERNNSVELSEKGNNMVSQKEPDLFVMESLDEALEKIDKDEGLPYDKKQKVKDEITQKFLDKNEKLHNIKQLLKSYMLFQKDVDYVVTDNKVIIVDKFTGRMMPGRRFSDGLHQALEAKESVKIEEASQTFATITLQNYFRMYDKLAGMTGTAVTEESEFLEIYKLPTVVIPTNEPITRQDHNDMIYISKNEKYKAIIDEIEYWHKLQKPVLVGTISVEVSETLGRLLRRRGIKHNILNAKHHEQEAEIVKNAGQPGAVTIATNMAGRGTDIKLGKGVVTKPKEEYRDIDAKPTEEYPFGLPLDGLHVVGTERHESRRIDRQLRGRSGRQGDPGSSRFYLSLEDDLMRLFGSERIAPMMMKMGLQQGEAITHPWMTKAVSRAQKRVENYNFEIRKQLIKYDEVMNQQREVIYQYRRNVLKGYNLNLEILDMVKDTLAMTIEDIYGNLVYEEDWNLEHICSWLKNNLNVQLEPSELETGRKDLAALQDVVEEKVLAAYQQRENEMGSEQMRELERRALLSVVDENWREHLREMDLMKEGIGLRAYGQKDPLIEYKKESFNLFQELVAKINKEVTKKVFTAYIITPDNIQEYLRHANLNHSEVSAFAKAASGGASQPKQQEKQQKPVRKPRTVEHKVGRNDPCPCGSGKKYKKCCGRPQTNR